jgi:predicted DNA-binding transcriptional regulator YafY
MLILIEALRRRRSPVTAAKLAEELGVSVRTLYRDIQALIAQGVPIEGEAGVGYVMHPGFLLPPIMLDAGEIEALVLGSRLVAEQGDADLAAAGFQALAKIIAVLPKEAREQAGLTALFAQPRAAPAPPQGDAASMVRRAVREERLLRFTYQSTTTAELQSRTVKPVAIGFFKTTRLLAAWCLKREAFRHFRIDRMVVPEILNERYRPARRTLLAQWKRSEAIPDQWG